MFLRNKPLEGVVNILDILDSANVICKIDHLLGWAKSGAKSHRFHVDRRCGLAGIEIERLLARYGVRIFGRGFRSGSRDRPPTLYFSTSGDQARWTEYLLHRGGIPVVSRAVDPQSAARALELRRRGEPMPTPWAGEPPADAEKRWADAAVKRETSKRGPKRRRRKRKSDDPMDKVLGALDRLF